MTSSSFRTLVWLLAAVVAACSGPLATPTPTAPIQPTDQPTALPTASPIPATPGFTPHGPTLEPSPTPGPTLPTGPIADFLSADLDRILAEQLALYRIPGQNAAIIFPDGSRWNGAAGFADVDRSLPATPETTFVVGSITKTFVTAAVMLLAEEGALAIDDPLADYVPDYPNAANIKLVHLMNYTSGLYDYFNHPEYNVRVFNEPDHHWTPQEVLDNFVLEPYFEPGERHKYSNTNFILLGQVIEQVTGKELGEVLHERFIGPLGLDNTFVQGFEAPPPGSARGYLVRADGPVALDDDTDYRPTLSAATVAWGAGDIVSTSADLADWARSVYGGDLLEADSLASMTDHSLFPSAAYGLGTRTRVFQGQRMFGHTGSLRGFAAAMWHYPSVDLTIVVLTNRGRIEANPIVDALGALAMPYAEAYSAQ